MVADGGQTFIFNEDCFVINVDFGHQGLGQINEDGESREPPSCTSFSIVVNFDNFAQRVTNGTNNLFVVVSEREHRKPRPSDDLVNGVVHGGEIWVPCWTER